MRNFLKLTEGLDVSALLLAVTSQPELWNEYKVRTQGHPESVHRVVDDIVLRYNRFEPGEDFVDKVCSSIDCVDYPGWHRVPQAHPFIHGLMTRVAGVHLGRVMISRVGPGIAIPPHSDRIEPAEQAFPDRVPPAVYYKRYHVCLTSAPGVRFICGDEGAFEEVYMAPGEAWWFNNQKLHAVANNSQKDRIHLICDIRSERDFYAPRSSPVSA